MRFFKGEPLIIAFEARARASFGRRGRRGRYGAGFSFGAAVAAAFIAATWGGAALASSYGNEVACRVGTETISKREVERRMGEKLLSLRAKRDRLIARGRGEEAEKLYLAGYVPLFREALRVLVRERLMLQAAREPDTQLVFNINENALRERVNTHWEAIRFLRGKIPRGASAGEVERIKKELRLSEPLRPTWELLRRMGRDNPHEVSKEDLRKAVREGLTLQAFRNQFANKPVTRPEVIAYYRRHLSEYTRPAGYKVRIVQLNLYKRKGRSWVPAGEPEKLREKISSWRRWIVESGEPFAKIAAKYSTDKENAARGGLLMGPDEEPYVTADCCPPAIFRVIRRLPVGTVSKVFEIRGRGAQRFYGRYLFAMVEERRPASPPPPTGKLYKKLAEKLNREKRNRLEKEWFREALQKTLVVDNNGKRLPLKFFFPAEAAAEHGGRTEP